MNKYVVDTMNTLNSVTNTSKSEIKTQFGSAGLNICIEASCHICNLCDHMIFNKR